MTPEHKRKLAAGRQHAAKAREREGIARVRAFSAYLRSSARRPDGTWPRVPMPAIPTDEEWNKARAAGVVT